MIRLIVLAALFATPAMAQQQPAFVPYTISHDDHTKIMNYLGEQPAKFATPLINHLNALAQRAATEKGAADKNPKPKED